MRFFLFLLVCISFSSCSSSLVNSTSNFEKNEVIAHRGAWKQNNLPQNSIASLRQAIVLKCVGTEFDVRMTSDDVLIVTHDADYNNMVVEESTYSELAKRKLSNGELLPTLKDFLKAGMKNNPTTGLVCEIKPASSAAREAIIAQKVLRLVKEVGAEAYILAYISFSYNVLKTLKELDNEVITQYLDGSKSPDVLYSDGISGLDYHKDKFRENPQWIKESKDKNLILNAWTVNSIEDMDWLLLHEFNYITTDEPELLFKRIKQIRMKNTVN